MIEQSILKETTMTTWWYWDFTPKTSKRKHKALTLGHHFSGYRVCSLHRETTAVPGSAQAGDPVSTKDHPSLDLKNPANDPAT